MISPWPNENVICQNRVYVMGDYESIGWKKVLKNCQEALRRIERALENDDDMPLKRRHLFKKRVKELKTQISFVRIAIKLRKKFTRGGRHVAPVESEGTESESDGWPSLDEADTGGGWESPVRVRRSDRLNK